MNANIKTSSEAAYIQEVSHNKEGMKNEITFYERKEIGSTYSIPRTENSRVAQKDKKV